MAEASSLELRLERIKRLGNLRFEYLKRFHQGGPISRAYSERAMHLHVHYLSGLSHIALLTGPFSGSKTAKLCEPIPTLTE